MSDGEATTSTTESNVTSETNLENFDEPEPKRRKPNIHSVSNDDPKKYKLVERLGGILCCAVCLDLPRAAVFQVSCCFFSNLFTFFFCNILFLFLLRRGD